MNPPLAIQKDGLGSSVMPSMKFQFLGTRHGIIGSGMGYSKNISYTHNLWHYGLYIQQQN